MEGGGDNEGAMDIVCRDGGQVPVVSAAEAGVRTGRGEKELPKKGKMAGMGREVDI